jgi:hypothetical protein
MKKIRGGKSIGVTIYLYMETSQGNSLCSYLYHKQKCHVFLFLFFFFIKSDNRRAEQVCPVGRIGPSGRGEVVGEGDRRVNIVQKMCTHI